MKSRFRQYNGPMDIVAKSICAGICLFTLLYIAGIFAHLKIYFLENQFNALFLAAVQTAIFLLVPASKKARKDRLPWYDILLICGSLPGNIYIFAKALELANFAKISADPLEIVLGAITLLTLMEAVRRTMGWAMIIISIAFLAYAKFGYLASGVLNVYRYDFSTLAADIYLGDLGVYGNLLTVATTMIIAFVTFGVFLTRAGGGRFFMNLALAVAGHFRGGPAKVAVIGSALFGTLSGSASANVAVTGTVTIPLMKETGYRPHYAGAVEAVASTGGQIMPPIMGGVAFIMAGMLQITYTSVAIMAVIPAILFFLSLFIQIDLQAAKTGLKGLPPAQLPPVGKTLREGLEMTVPLILLLVFLFVLGHPPAIAAVYSILIVVAVSLFRKENRLNVKKIADCLAEGFRATMDVAAVIALAGIIVGVLVGTGLGPKLSAALVSLFGGSLLMLVIAAGIAIYIMGMGVSVIASYILVSVLVAPALEKLGVPLVVTHFFIMYMVTTTFITPPYCTAAFVASSIAGAHPYRIGFQAMQLGMVAYLVPFIIIYNPALIMIGTAGDIVLATVTAIIAIYSLSVGIEGYLFSRTSWLQRVLFIVGGLSLFVPGLYSDLVGAAIMLGAVLWQWSTRPKPIHISGVTQKESPL